MHFTIELRLLSFLDKISINSRESGNLKGGTDRVQFLSKSKFVSELESEGIEMQMTERD